MSFAITSVIVWKDSSLTTCGVKCNVKLQWCSQGEDLKPWTFEAKSKTKGPKATKHMATAEIKIRSTSDSLTG